MADKKYCPFSAIVKDGAPILCEKHFCEWWDQELGRCLIFRIGLELHNIRQILKKGGGA